ncbi:uncharacterized protein LOC143348746 [Colletes latitarsis]|uniref:uncharacterized protein LOC143348746 n=1 Tax=Colletes latitarsis TaxID=2605962 RepID=UPI004036EB72
MFVHALRAQRVGLAIAAEPYMIPDKPNWVGSLCGLAVMVWAWPPDSPPVTILQRGRGFLAVQWGTIAVVGCYVSPNCDLATYAAYLDVVGECIRRCLPRPVLVLGDFNAHAAA